MARAHTIPVTGNRFEVRRGNFGSLGTDRSESAKIALQTRVIFVDERKDGIEEFSATTASSRSVKGAGSLGITHQQAGLAQQAQMPANSRLGLTQHFAELADRQFTAGQNSENPQSGRLASSPKGNE